MCKYNKNTLVKTKVDYLCKHSLEKMNGCHPILQDRVLKIITEIAQDHGVYFAVYSGYRTEEHQKVLYMQGREPISRVNAARRALNLRDITPTENKKTVTNVTYSWHNAGLAADLVLDDTVDLKIRWSWKGVKQYRLLGEYARRHNLMWGGSWRNFKDMPHVQLPCPYSLKEAAQYRTDFLFEKTSQYVNSSDALAK